jgi:hypothetical protein
MCRRATRRQFNNTGHDVRTFCSYDLDRLDLEAIGAGSWAERLPGAGVAA